LLLTEQYRKNLSTNLIDHSYDEVVKKLPKKIRDTIKNDPDFPVVLIISSLLYGQELTKYIPHKLKILTAQSDSITPRILRNGSRKDKRIALTFDACATVTKANTTALWLELY